MSLNPKKDDLTPTKKVKQVLSKEQQAFNRLYKRVQVLQEQIESESKKMETLSSYYQAEVLTKVIELGNHKIRLSRVLHQKRKLINLSSQQNKKLDKVILDLLNDAFSVVEPDEETKGIYDHYSLISFDEQALEQEAEVKAMFNHFMKSEFGVKIDPSILFEPNPDFEKIENDLKKQIEEGETKIKTKKRKKTKKQLENELIAQKQEEVKGKSLRSVYLSLAKILHPDTEKDEKLKLEKEETLKLVTVAYQNKDLMQMLKIQMKWVNAHEGLLSKADDVTMAAYARLLKDQVEQLEEDLEMVYFKTNNDWLAQYRFYTLAGARLDLVAKSDGYAASNALITEHIRHLEKGDSPKQAIKNCIEEYYTENEWF